MSQRKKEKKRGKKSVSLERARELEAAEEK
jgi:hypothetical protein